MLYLLLETRITQFLEETWLRSSCLYEIRENVECEYLSIKKGNGKSTTPNKSDVIDMLMMQLPPKSIAEKVAP